MCNCTICCGSFFRSLPKLVGMTEDSKITMAYHMVKLCHMLMHFLFDSDRRIVCCLKLLGQRTETTSIPFFSPIYTTPLHTQPLARQRLGLLSHTNCPVVLSLVYIRVCTRNVVLLPDHSGWINWCSFLFSWEIVESTGDKRQKGAPITQT